MGMFDSVYITCPGCGKPMEFQSKAGECEMMHYTVEDAPAPILYEIINDPRYHETCDTWVALVDPNYPPGEQARPKPRAAKVKPPENPETHFQGFKWWPEGKPFYYDNLVDDDPLSKPPLDLEDIVRAHEKKPAE